MAFSDGQLQTILDKLVAGCDVPGAVLGVYDGTRVVAVAAGTANLITGAAMTPDTVFLTGSITKVWVTTMLMTLVDSGKVGLDAPVRAYLPDFAVADPAASATVTVRHLVTHASGIDAADYIPDDLGRGDDAIAAYVSRLAGMGQLHAPGAYSSYCNAGFVIAGRLIEVITGSSFEQAFREHLIEPLDLKRTFLSAEEAILRHAAVGHFPADGGPIPTRRYLLPHVMAPAGATLTTTVADTLEFARVHLGGGVSAGGRRILSEASAAGMAAHEIDLPVPELGSFGLGWGRSDQGTAALLTHTGGSLGGFAQLVLAPERGVAFAAFANYAGAPQFHESLRRQVLEDVLGVPAPPPFRDEDRSVPPEFFAGTYVRRDAHTVIEADDEDVVLTITPTSEVLGQYMNAASSTVRCSWVGSRCFGLPAPGAGAAPAPLAHAIGCADGKPEFLFFGGRLSRRIG